MLGIAAGLHAILELPAHWPPEREVLAALRGASIGLRALGDYLRNTPAPTPSRLVVGYATPPQHAYAPAVAALVRALRALEP